jgi:C1A family cysteine protease
MVNIEEINLQEDIMHNSKKIQTWLFGLISLSLLFAFASFTYASQAELDEINYAIHSKGAHWLAGETPISKLSPEERKMRLGAMKPFLSTADVLSATGGASTSSLTGTAPATLDWRNYNGYNYVTPVRDQGNCGSCWAFATTAALESNVLIVNGISALNLAEEIMLSCSGAGSCSGGYIDGASNFSVSTGLPPESYDPYTATNGQCSSAATGWQTATSQISSWHWVTTTSPTVDAIKNDLNTYGPLVTTMQVYSDFFYYSGGVYQYISGTKQGGHAILIVGYDDTGQYFIVKNSWGSGWGESGYFKIAYSQLSNAVNFGDYTIGYYTSNQPPGITVSSPNGGESWQAGATHTITWTYSGNPGAYVNIDLLNSGSFVSTIASSVSIGSGGSGSYIWNIPSTQAQGNLYQIRVTSTANSAYTDTSNSSFSISPPLPPSITVIAPNGGQSWRISSNQQIQWSYTGNPGSYVKIELLQGTTASTATVAKTIVSSTTIGSGGSGSYLWKIPRTQTTANNSWIRITSTTNNSYTDTSDTSFSIVKK